MRREQLEHGIRSACQILERHEVIVIGSQAILGTFEEARLPPEATMSLEVDILPISDNEDETAAMAELLAASAGEFSTFEETHGFSIDGVDLGTAILPDGWRERLTAVQNDNTAPPSGTPQFTGWCLEPHDLCAAKLCALRQKDINFVSALIEAGLVDRKTIAQRLKTIPENHKTKATLALEWIERS
jgi:hypothetical protein